MFQLIVFIMITSAFSVILLIDRSRLRKMKVQIEQKDELISAQTKARVDILNNINQEIRTPLNAIVGFSEQLSHTSLEKEQRELLKTVERAAGMLMKMVNNVQDLSRLEKKELILQQQPFSLYQVFSEVSTVARPQASRKQLQFESVYQGNRQLQLAGDYFRLKQILTNLVDNAIRYTDSGIVTLHIKADRLEDNTAIINVTVTDTGRGIAPELLPLLFEHFSRKRIPDSAVVNGAGLGLAITNGLLELHKGTISVDSSVGYGSTFICNIPFEVSQVPQTTLITHREIEQMNTGFMEGRVVLIADDQEMNLVLLEKILTRWKCKFDTAPDGKEAYDLFYANNYDMVLLDLQMPIMSGIEVVRRIREDRNSGKSNIPVLALTADTTLPDNDAFLEVGFDDYLLKPFRERDIYNVIVKHLPVLKKQVQG
jgi:signal transduction histidine kinase/CheY-like chemotaxis protein